MGQNNFVNYPNIYPRHEVMVKFKCKNCKKDFLDKVDENVYKHVIKDPLFLNSKICDECKKEEMRSAFRKVSTIFLGKKGKN